MPNRGRWRSPSLSIWQVVVALSWQASPDEVSAHIETGVSSLGTLVAHLP